MYHIVEEHSSGYKARLLSYRTLDDCIKEIDRLSKQHRDRNYVGFKDTSRYAVIGWFIWQ